jgi:hypothetical protein
MTDEDYYSIRGEYWDQDGCIVDADGDVGDSNHAGIAIEHAGHLLFSYFDMEHSLDEFATFDVNLTTFMKKMKADGKLNENETMLLNEGILYHKNNGGYDAAHEFLLRKQEEDADRDYLGLLGIAIGTSGNKAVEHAIGYWNWIRIAKNDIQVGVLDPDSAKRIREVVLEIVTEIEGTHPDYEIDENRFKVWVDVQFGPRREMSLQELYDFSVVLPGIDTEALTRNARKEVQRMDEAIANPTYKGKQGD